MYFQVISWVMSRVMMHCEKERSWREKEAPVLLDRQESYIVLVEE